MLLLSVLLTGCGDRNATPTPAPPSAAAEPPSPVPAAAPPDAPPPSELRSGEPEVLGTFEETLARVLELEADAEFHEAYQLCRKLRSEFKDHPGIGEASEVLARVRTFRNEASSIRYAIDQLGVDRSEVVQVAQRELIARGDLGALFLRKAVRERDGTIASRAAGILALISDGQASAVIAERYLADNDTDLRHALLGALLTLSPGIDIHSLYALSVHARTSQVSEETAAGIRDIALRRCRTVLPPDAPEWLLAQIDDQPTPETRAAGELLSFVYRAGTSRSDEAFDALFGEAGAIDRLRRHADAAAGSDAPDMAAWGKQVGLWFASYDYDALTERLALWYRFDEGAGTKVKDASGKSGYGTLKGMGEDAWVAGHDGHGLHFDGADDVVESLVKKFPLSKIQQGDYTFAAWVKPEELPSGQQPDTMAGIVIKPGYHCGLTLSPDGHFRHEHWLKGRQGVSAQGRTAVGVGEWHHVVGVVDRRIGEVCVYVDGAPDGKTAFKRGTTGDSSQDDQPVRIGMAQPSSQYAWRFRGIIDDVRIYKRALTATDVQALYSLGELATPARRPPNPR